MNSNRSSTKYKMPMVKLKTSTTGILLLFYGIIQMEQIVDGMTNVGGVYAVIMKLHSVEHIFHVHQIQKGQTNKFLIQITVGIIVSL